MSSMKFLFGRAFWLGLSAAVFTFCLSPLAADEAAVERRDQQADPARAVNQAAQAARLALEGERRESPILLLAAAELLGELVQVRAPEGVAVQLGDEEAEQVAPSALSPHHLLEKAAQLAEGDEHLTAIVERQLDQLGERGVPVEAIDPDSLVVAIGGGHLEPSGPGVETGWIDAPFVANAPAEVTLLVPDTHAYYLDVWVTESESGFPVASGRHVDDFVSVAQWIPRRSVVHRIHVQNNGDLPTRIFVFANVSIEDVGGGVPVIDPEPVPEPPAPLPPDPEPPEDAPGRPAPF